MSKFKVGDIVVGTCKKHEPYTITCHGVLCEVVGVVNKDLMLVQPVGEGVEKSLYGGFEVREEYFAFYSELENLIEKANNGLIALERLANEHKTKIVWSQLGSHAGWYLSGGDYLPRIKKKD